MIVAPGEIKLWYATLQAVCVCSKKYLPNTAKMEMINGWMNFENGNVQMNLENGNGQMNLETKRN